jgi:hypothetical protein
MALSERIAVAKKAYKETFRCKLMSITIDPKLSKKDIDALISVINSNPLSEDHVPNVRLAYALREEGYDVSASAVDRHRRGDCSCYRTVLGE